MINKISYFIRAVLVLLLFFNFFLARTQNQLQINIEPSEVTAKFFITTTGFERRECTLEIIVPPKNADTAYIAEDPVVGGPELVYIQDTIFYRYDTLLLARQCQNNVEEYFDTLQVIIQINHPYGQTIYTDTTTTNIDTLAMHYFIFVNDCQLILIEEPNYASFSYFSYELMDDTATYYYKANDNWTGIDTVYLEYGCITGNGPDWYDTIALVIHVVQGTTGISDGLFPTPEIYPNPATQKVYIRFGQQYPKDLKIKLHSLDGVLLREEKNVRKISTAGLKPGIYLLQLEYDGRQVVRKVMVSGG